MALNFLKGKSPDTTGSQPSADAPLGEAQRLPTPSFVKELQSNRAATPRTEPTVVDLVPEELRDEFAGLLGGLEAELMAPAAESRPAAARPQDFRFQDARSFETRTESRPEPQPAKPIPPASAAALSATGSATDDALLREAQTLITALEPQNSQALDPVLSQIDTLAVQVERDRKELEAARGTAELLSAENSRLSEENKRLRTVVKSLIAAVDGDRRRHTDQLGEAERRLRGLSRTT
jgi:hypothetical protein